MKNTDEAQKQLKALVESFKEPDKLEGMIEKVILDPVAKPCQKWSLLNRLMMMMQGTYDARGHRQWQEIGRNPVDWSKKIYILAPLMVKIKEKNEKTGEEEEREFCTGFRHISLYAEENTYGKEIQHVKNAPKKLPPLAEVAKSWGIELQWEVQAGALGSYSPAENKIRLGTESPEVFFHELAHKGDEKANGKLAPGQDAIQEAVAELTSAVLCRMYGYNSDKGAYDYIRRYADGHTPEAVIQLVSKAIKRVEATLDLILKTKEGIVA